MKQTELEEIITKLGKTTRDATTAPGLVLFKNSADKIFAIVHDGSDPLRIEAKCDPQLAKHLRQQYETVMASRNMDARSWNELVLTGQLSDQEVIDLLSLSYKIT